MALVVLDPGHGGTTMEGGSSPNNATGPNGTKDKDLVLDIAKRVNEQLRARNISTLMTRDSDVNIGISKRVQIAKEALADAFISIHLNGNINPTVQGTETWISHKEKSDSISKSLAKSIQESLVAVTGYRNRGVKAENPDPSGVLDPERHHWQTAISLVEISFLTDPEDEARLTSPLTGVQYKNQIAEALGFAIFSHLNSRGLA
jgi:N-acetylmuramoyl-L-alanine amidase